MNVTACVLVGLLGNLRENGPAEFDRYLLMAGVMGGYTTFSTFSLRTLELFQKGSTPPALANIALSLVLCLLGVWIGHTLGNALGSQWKG